MRKGRKLTDRTIQVDRNVHRRYLKFDSVNEKKYVLLISDIHWDNPHCMRDKLKADLDEAVKRNARILINGDFFCLMQGKYDPRRSKRNIRPEHNENNYLDAVINDAVNWWKPYAHHIDVISYGNHETAIIRNCETDPLQRFVDLLNRECGSSVYTGGYGGWIIIHASYATAEKAFKIKYHHGYGGGGPVTLGTIQNNRMMTYVYGADMIWMGHVHQDYELTYTVESLDRNGVVQLKDILHVRTPSYKEEYEGGYGHYHVERGRPPKPVGGRWLELEWSRKLTDGVRTNELLARTFKT